MKSARGRLVVTWLADGGLRVGELGGLHPVDLHLRESAACSECRRLPLHACHRPNNPNRAEVKTKHSWQVEHGTTGGLARRVSPAMVHAYFECTTTEYPRGTGQGMLLVQLHGAGTGQPWAPVGARRMLGRAGKRAGLPGGGETPCLRHTFTSAVLDAADGNLLIASRRMGSTATVDEVYGHVDVHAPFDAPSGYDPQMSVVRAILVLRRHPGAAIRGERHG